MVEAKPINHTSSLSRDAFAELSRKLAMHQTANPAWRATAGHIRTPTGLRAAPAGASTATAAQLYSSIAATNPRWARLDPSLRASQQGHVTFLMSFTDETASWKIVKV